MPVGVFGDNPFEDPGSAKKIPTFAALPAVRANQIGTWRADLPPSYQAYTGAMIELATTIARWRKVT